MLEIDAVDGKLTAEAVRKALVSYRTNAERIFYVEPGLVYISNPTELGTLYSLAELKKLSKVCREEGLFLYVDGARLAYALAAGDIKLEDYALLTDAFCIGGTKCGALFGEAAVIINPALKDDFRTIMKQGGAVLAKGRLLGLQFETLFTDGLYYKICRHGVELALQIKAAVQERGLGFVTDSTTNQQFIIFPQAMYDELSKQFALAPWEYMDDGRIAARICTSWATDPTQVDRLCNMIRQL